MVTYEPSLIVSALEAEPQRVVNTERTLVGDARKKAAAGVPENLCPEVEGDLVGHIVHSAELWAAERESAQAQRWQGHEVRVLELGLFLDCVEGGFLQVQVWSLQVEVWHVGEYFAEEIWPVEHILRWQNSS